MMIILGCAAAFAQGLNLDPDLDLPINPYWGEPVVYSTAWDDVLNWNRWDGVTSTHTWASGFPPNPSEPGGTVTAVIPGGGDSILVRWEDGALDWYGTNYDDDTAGWIGPVRIGSGWNVFTSIAGAGQGVVYGLTSDGLLYWYRYNGYRDARGYGTSGWDGWTLVRTGMQAITKILASSDGSLYGLAANGDLYYYQHLGWNPPYPSGDPWWGEAQQVGTGWNTFHVIVAFPDDQLLGVRWENPTASWWYHHTPGTTPAAWLGAVPFPYPYDEPSASGPPPSWPAAPYGLGLIGWALMP